MSNISNHAADISITGNHRTLLADCINKVMRDAKTAGQTRLNLWGIAYSDDPHHRYAGVTTFKRGFGGRDVVFVHAHDLVVRRLRYELDYIIETIRRKKRGL